MERKLSEFKDIRFDYMKAVILNKYAYAFGFKEGIIFNKMEGVWFKNWIDPNKHYAKRNYQSIFSPYNNIVFKFSPIGD